MSLLRTLRFRIRALFRGQELDEGMSDEMRFHIDMLTMEYRNKGMPSEWARRQALLDFGGMEQKKEEVRAARGVMFIDNRIRDMRFTLRSLRKHSAFTMAVVLTLALGIGANTAIFSVVNGVLMRPLAYPESDRLVDISQEISPGIRPQSSGGVFMDWEDNSTSFESMAAMHDVSQNLSGQGEPISLDGWTVTADFLDVLRIAPQLGRGFRASDDDAGANTHVVVLTDSLWRSQFSADSEVLGKTVYLDDQAYEVIGVLPPRALFYENIKYLIPSGIRADEWKQSRDYMYVLNVIGRLKEGVTLEQAESELNAIKERLRSEYPYRQAPWGVSVMSLHENYFGDAADSLYMLLVAVGLVLMVACANVANLLLAKSSTRESELALRVALGATRGRIVGQLLTESLFLSAGGGLVGVLFGLYLINPLSSFVGIAQLPTVETSMDWTVLGFVGGITILTGILSGMFPAWRMSKPELANAMRDGARGSSGGHHRKVQSSLIVAQTAFAVTLLVCVGLLLRSFYIASNEPTGFQTDRALVFEISCTEIKAPTPEARIQYTDNLMEQLRSIPGVESVGVCTFLPMSGNGYGDMIHREDSEDDFAEATVSYNAVSADYFESMEMPLKSGRQLDVSDNQVDAPKVMVINEVLEASMFPEGDALGKRIRFKEESYEVVGIVGNVRQFRQDIPPRSEIYFPIIHFPWNTSYVMKTQVPPLSLADEVRRVVRDYDPDQAIGGLESLELMVDRNLQGRSIIIVLLSIFGGSALLLACVGLYGTMSFSVTQRTKELGIRIALGAGRSRVMSSVQREGILLVGIGLLLGVAGSLGASRLIGSQLYSTSSVDPWVLALVAVLLFAVGYVACWVPAWRATRIDPIIALRSE